MTAAKQTKPQVPLKDFCTIQDVAALIQVSENVSQDYTDIRETAHAEGYLPARGYPRRTRSARDGQTPRLRP
ncbi:hypothetical protein ADJ70_04250 [Olsenella sp. oral taxon 807]|uniref:hypothetical protein n=1 Tax=Olsenella sp. oral taxon 807 TaxID=712411 RepID=UPI000679EA68|nr:hypothetical protein [Olsenella sp. oral taxon 807]AKT48350.1 hypothetical protein ADJ70_04250 [Olsenella sp. oral taxon 807]